MHPAVVEVTPHDDHLLSVVFENGERGWLDIKPFLEFGVFQKIKDDHAFRQVRISFDTIEWSCGVDLDPEYVSNLENWHKPAHFAKLLREALKNEGV